MGSTPHGPNAQMRIAAELQQNADTDAFLKRIVTCNEKWIGNDNLKRKWSCLNFNERA